MSDFVSSGTLRGLTGSPQKSRQAAWLRANRWRFELDQFGRPRVATAYYERRQAGIADDAPPTQCEPAAVSAGFTPPSWWPTCWPWNRRAFPYAQEPWFAAGGNLVELLKRPESAAYWLKTVDQLRAASRPHAEWPMDFEGGVYFLFCGGELTYVGIAGLYANRFDDHLKNGRQWDTVTLLPLFFDAAKIVESYYIRALQPPENVSDGTNRALWGWKP